MRKLGSFLASRKFILFSEGRPEFSAKATDLWAMGVILFGLYFGSLPFVGGNIIEIRESILNQE